MDAFLSTPSVRRATADRRLFRHQRVFLSTPSVRRATSPAWPALPAIRHFYPRPPCGGRRSPCNAPSISGDISIHALRAEGDVPATMVICCVKAFLSTPSVRRATLSWVPVFLPILNFYPRPPCGGRQPPGWHSSSWIIISIHALRAEGDIVAAAAVPGHGYFYPRPPCGGRPQLSYSSLKAPAFLSTPSVRRATRSRSTLQRVWRYFYPRPPCGGRLGREGHFYSRQNISIHALRAEGDASAALAMAYAWNFYPRPPCGGRRSAAWWTQFPAWHFYPRPPCGGRRQKFTKYCLLLQHKHENSSF